MRALAVSGWLLALGLGAVLAIMLRATDTAEIFGGRENGHRC